MSERPNEHITDLLAASASGVAGSRERLFESVYQELRRIANAQMRHSPGRTLQPTALVHEAYMRLYKGEEGPLFASRKHFFAAAAKAMRHILVDDVRTKRRLKRGGPGASGHVRSEGSDGDGSQASQETGTVEGEKTAGAAAARGVEWHQTKSEPAVYDQDPVEILNIHEALIRLEAVAPRQAKVVELRFFGGFTVDETAEALDVSPRCVDNDWRLARVWLHRELSAGLTSRVSHDREHTKRDRQSS